MNSGLYTAYSGLRAQMDALDMLSNNLSNLSTAGFKEEKAFFTLLNQSIDSSGAGEINSVINSQAILAGGLLNTMDGSLTMTKRDLDIALSGNGFLTIQAPQGVRYTRNGNLSINSEAQLCTADGFPVLGESGRPIALGRGKVNIDEGGGVFLDSTRVDSLKIVTFDNPAMLAKEGQSLLMQREAQAAEKPANAKVKQGYLEQSNVNPVSSVVQLIGVMRHFEAIQKSLDVVMNDLNAKSIEKIGR